MNLYLLFLILLVFYRIKIKPIKNSDDFLSKTNTTSINGIFVLIVFYSHLTTYFEPIMSKDFMMFNFREYLGQLMVTPFLFFSGYGVYESIKNKKEKYINKIPQKRILNTWIKFIFGISLFLIFNLIKGIKYKFSVTLLSFFAWESIGNSTWYIFCIFFMYIFTYISFKIFDKDDKKAIKLSFILTFMYILIMNVYKFHFWFNTALCYNFGLLFSYYKDEIKQILFDNKKYFYILIPTVITFVFLRSYRFNPFMYELYSVIFVFLLCLISVKVKIENRILQWFGKHIFWIYMLQRIPMIYFQSTNLINHIYRYSFVVFICTMGASFICDYIFSSFLPLIKHKVHRKKN